MGIAKCQQKCINSPGSYQCICDRGDNFLKYMIIENIFRVSIGNRRSHMWRYWWMQNLGKVGLVDFEF